MYRREFRNPGGIRVKRSGATPRTLKGLSGSLVVSAIANSYIHIGSKKYRIEYDRVELDRLARRRFLNQYEVMRFSSKINIDYVENIVYRDIPVIPGSSLKGCIRSRLELLFHAENNVVPSCFIRSGRIPRVPIPKGLQGWRHYKVWGDIIAEDRDRACDASRAEYFKDIQICVVCNIFGTSGIASRICFSNLVPRDKDCLEKLSLDFGEKILAFKKNTVFDGEITFLGLDLVELGLIFIGLNVHKDKSILIGKSKYRDRVVNGKKEKFGRLKINIERIEFARYSDLSLVKDVMGDIFDEEKYMVKGENVKKFISLAVGKAYEKYGEWLRDICEVDVLG